MRPSTGNDEIDRAVDALSFQKSRAISEADMYSNRREYHDLSKKTFKRAAILERELAALLRIANDGRYDIELLSGGFCALKAENAFFTRLIDDELAIVKWDNDVQEEEYAKFHERAMKLLEG